VRFLADWLPTRCAVVAIIIVVMVRPVLARSYLHCSTTQVVIISASTGETSSRSEENLSFVIDDAAKTLTFADGGSFAVTRLDRNWISANHDDIFYEFDRQGGTLSYASSTTKNNITSTIVGSGRCG
jgi:hypothetical protein